MYTISKSSVVFNVFMNIGTYLLFTVFCFYFARPPAFLIRWLNQNIAHSRYFPGKPKMLRQVVTLKQMSIYETVAVCFCGAAKTTSIGIPLVEAMWTEADPLTRAYIEIPVLLYTIEQVFVAQMLVYFFRWWMRREQRKSQAEDEDDEDGIEGRHPEVAIEASVVLQPLDPKS